MSYTYLPLFFITWAFFTLECLQAQPHIFDSNDLLEIEIQVDMDELQADRGEEVSYHDAVLIYYEGDSLISVKTELRARGHFRRPAPNMRASSFQVEIWKKGSSGNPFRKGSGDQDG